VISYKKNNEIKVPVIGDPEKMGLSHDKGQRFGS